MGGGMELTDYALQAAGANFVHASSTMTSDNVSRPAGDLASLTGIGSSVTMYLKGLNVARAALADAARTGSESAAALMSESSELDSFISETLGTGYAVEGGPA